MKSQNCVKNKKRRRGSDGQGYSVSEVVRMMNNEINEANGDEK